LISRVEGVVVLMGSRRMLKTVIQRGRRREITGIVPSEVR
jgi:hypothetical protein